LEIEKSIWEERVGENASAKGLGLCNRVKGGVCTKKGKMYLLSREKREKVQAFVEDQLRKGYI